MSDSETPVICLDGPSGVGKGTVCLAVAKKLGWHILDSGSLYRITALQCDRSHSRDDIDSINEFQLTDIISNLNISYVEKNGQLAIMLNDEDISECIRAEEIGEKASQIAVIPAVRSALLDRQRDFLQSPGLVADGRDMGTVVFPDSVLKFYLTASAEQRARRRYKQLKDKGIDVNLPSLVEDLRQRDERDMNREAAPLKPASDAIIIDTSSLDVEQVTNEVMQRVEQVLGLQV